MKKLLHERLREIKNSDCESLAAVAGVKCHAFCNRYACHKEIYKALADEIEKYYIPRPRFEDGEPVQSSDMEEIGGLATCRVYTDGSWKFDPDKYEDERNPKPWDEQQGRQCDFIKRPEPKVLDADGVEIKVGDTVWPINDPEMKMTVDNFQQIYGQDATVNCEFEGEFYNFNPDKLTHREPDSLEKLLDDLRDLVPFMPAAELTVNTSDLISITNRLTAIMERDA